MNPKPCPSTVCRTCLIIALDPQTPPTHCRLCGLPVRSCKCANT